MNLEGIVSMLLRRDQHGDPDAAAAQRRLADLEARLHILEVRQKLQFTEVQDDDPHDD